MRSRSTCAVASRPPAGAPGAASSSTATLAGRPTQRPSPARQSRGTASDSVLLGLDDARRIEPDLTGTEEALRQELAALATLTAERDLARGLKPVATAHFDAVSGRVSEMATESEQTYRETDDKLAGTIEKASQGR